MTTWGELLAARRGEHYARHAWLTFGGTWSVPGTGYCSWVLGAASDELVYEVPIAGPYTFGPVPGAGQPPRLDAPSYRQSVAIAVRNAVDWINAHPGQTFGLAGYSQGAEAASRVLMALQPGGELEGRAGDFVGGFTFGNPSRERGHTFPGGRDPGGRGISPTRLSATPDTWHDYAQPGDLYTTAATGAVGKVLEAGYQWGIDLQLNDPLAFLAAMVQNTLRLVEDAGVDLPVPNVPALVPAALLGLLAALIPQLHAAGDTETGAAVQAAVLALRFLADQPPTRAHITYEVAQVLPGVTYLEHARQHVNTVAAATPARAA